MAGRYHERKSDGLARNTRFKCNRVARKPASDDSASIEKVNIFAALRSVNFVIRLIILCFLGAQILSTSRALAQSSDSLAAPKYIVIVEHKNGQTTKGLLHSMDMRSIDLINFIHRDSIIHITVPAYDVAAIRYRKDGKIRRHALIGLGIGVAAGAIVGSVTYDAHKCDFNTCVEKGVDPLTTSVLGGILGAGTGAIIGSRYTKIDLAGDPLKYEAAITFFENQEK